jgi:tetratricopeptide (TPR) repeat protein/predicted Ser/Thr protein kinase
MSRSRPDDAPTLTRSPEPAVDPLGHTATARPGARRDEGPGAPMAEVTSDGGGADVSIPPSLYRRFEGFQLLGRGGMGVVYKAVDIRLGRPVAIKLLAAFGPSSSGGILHEARSQARLRHEHACEVYEAGIADHVPFIVMQYIDGLPLRDARDQMTLEEKVRGVRRVATALHEAHRLGLVHRDVKPANILVERGEDGAWKPYILDFGIARDVGDGGQTSPAAVLGTPAFMAPEQAAGKVRSLDRRTDVYGLGATLYDVLAGRPPFSGDSALEILHQVSHQEAPPLRSVDPTIPLDLEAIVMKCLEKDPVARYASAKALGEDLQRFLDGDPVTARRASWPFLLLKWARRHKAGVALSAGLVAAGLLVAGLWVYERNRAEQQAMLARDLSKDAKEMEFFLRTAYAMPLHDVGRERALVRQQFGSIQARMADAGEIGEGPGHEALGRGALALHDASSALAHFQKAQRAGYRSPDLDYAMGIALSDLYKRALDETKRIQSEAQRKARVLAIEAEYKAPALEHLRAARGATRTLSEDMGANPGQAASPPPKLGGPLVSPTYLEGLIAYHEGRYEDAQRLSERAFKEAPWLYEAKRLEGEARFVIGSRHRADKGFDYERAMEQFKLAAAAYEIAASLGRSDPAVHAGECELWIQTMNAESERGESMRPSFEKARSACGRAVAADPSRGEAYVKLAFAHNCFAWWVATGRHKGEDPESALREAAARAGEAAQKSPGDAMAHYILGAVERSRALDALNRGHSPREALDRAIAGYEAALRLDPDFAWAQNEICSSLALRGKAACQMGRDPTGDFAAASGHCDRAIALDPDFTYPRVNKVILTIYEAEHRADSGLSPEAPVARGLALIGEMEKQSPPLQTIPLWRAHLMRARALYAIAAGKDAEEPLAEAETAARRLSATAPSADETLGLVTLARARSALARGEDAEAWIREACASLARAVEATPLDADDRVWLAEAHLLAFRWATRRGRTDAGSLDAAEAALAPLVAALPGAATPPPLDNLRVLTTLAEIHAARAGLGARSRADAESEIERGIARAGQALGRNPDFGPALSVLGRLWLLRARAGGSLASRKEAAARAVAAFEQALRGNPLLARTEQSLLDEARGITGEVAVAR